MLQVRRFTGILRCPEGSPGDEATHAPCGVAARCNEAWLNRRTAKKPAIPAASPILGAVVISECCSTPKQVCRRVSTFYGRPRAIEVQFCPLRALCTTCTGLKLGCRQGRPRRWDSSECGLIRCECDRVGRCCVITSWCHLESPAFSRLVGDVLSFSLACSEWTCSDAVT